MLISLIHSENFYAQKLREFRDFTKKDSIPLYNIADEDRLRINGTLKISNEFSANYNLNHWYDYRNLTLLEFGTKIKNLPILINFGSERGRIYENNFHQFVFNVKVDFQKLIEDKLNRLDIKKSIDGFDNQLSESILQEEIKKKVLEELSQKLPKEKADSLYKRVEEMKKFESKLNNPIEMEKIKQQKIKLKEYNLGNKIEGENYDSIIQNQLDFDKQYEKYKLGKADKELNDYRGKLEDIMSNKEKVLDIKNKAEGRLSAFKDKFNPLNKLDFKKLKISKFNLGQTSIDNSELVFRGFMVNGINLEMKSPFYFNAIYSLPFQNNFFTNYVVNSAQKNQVSTLGFAVGISPERRFNTQIGYYQFSEKNGSYSIQNESTKNIENRIFLIKSSFKLSKTIKSNLEIAKSESNKYGNQNLSGTNDLGVSTAIILKNELDLFSNNTNLKIDLQRVGLNYYSSANPFVQKGTGGLFSLTQKISNKLTLKTKIAYRFSADSSRDNSNLSSSGSLRYKVNRNTSLEARGSFFQNQIEYANMYSYMNSQMYSLTWSQRLKFKKTTHQLMTTAQYMRNEAKSSNELNNSGQTRYLQVISNYNSTIKKMAINANLEDNYHIDSSLHTISNGFNLNYAISNKTNIGTGFNSRISNMGINQLGGTLNFSTEITKLIISGNMLYVYDKVLNTNIISPQLRIAYKIF